jgi:catechol 2,3-dioxygenase-like lactoylglutathione lyase family enzyme
MADKDERAGGVKELGHLVLYVRDVERSVRFYRDVLGWRQVGPEGRRAAVPRGDVLERPNPPRAAA